MIATEYVPLARRTMKELSREQHLLHMALGIAGEVGEFIDAVKKSVIYGKPLDLVNLAEETGDGFWYAAGLLPELGVSAEVLQRAVDGGHAEGSQSRQKAGGSFEQAKVLLQINLSIAAVASAIANNPSNFLPGSSNAVQVVEGIGGALGYLCGLYALDPAQAMDLNIKKLAKRYGDKYSDVAALNRDTSAERVVLEGSPEMPANIASNKALHADNMAAPQ